MKRLISIILSLFLLLFASLSCEIAPPDEALNVHFIDVGQGDAILIDLEDTEILIDGGGKGAPTAGYISAYVDGPLEAMIVTHPHADHIGGLPAVLAAFDVEEIWLNGDTSESDAYTDLDNAVAAENATVHDAARGDSIQVGILNFFILNPEQPVSMDTNNNSVVVSLSYGGIDFLFTGDAEAPAEADMMSLLTDIDVLKVGHHGSDSSSSAAFLNVTQPEIAVYMAKTGNSYDHPHAVTIDALTDLGAAIYGTDTCGTIIVSTDGQTCTVSTEK